MIEWPSVLVWIATTLPTQALPDVEPGSVGLDATRLEQVGSALDRAIQAGTVPGGVVLVGRRGGIAYAKALGKRAVEPAEEPMTRDTIFDLASLTKPVATASTILSLVGDGKLAIDATMATAAPELVGGGKGRITIEQLLRHRAGMIPDNALEDYRHGAEEAWKRLAALPPRHVPGERFQYSDVNFLLLGRVAEVAGGKPLDQLAAERIFKPLGMLGTGFLPTDALHARVAPTAREEGRILRGTVHDPRARALGGVAGHAGLFGPADDLAIYAQMLLDGGVTREGTMVLRPELVRAMIDPGDTPAGQRRGLGWDLSTGYSAPRGDRFGPRSFGHTGFTGTSLWIDPDSKMFVILLTSRLHPDKMPNLSALRREVGTLAAAALVPEPSEGVKCGVDVLIAKGFAPLRGKRIGLITNHTGRARDGRSTIDVLHSAPGVRLTALFSPEHGIRGAVDTPSVADEVDKATGLTVHSLYNDHRQPTPEQLAGLDALVYDIQDIGARFYTYITTMRLAIEAAAAADVEFVVLDRPNPIGAAVGGPVADDGTESFIVPHPLPVRHGMTVGELARLFQLERQIGVDLTVIACENWTRRQLYDQTGLLWVNPSPNMRSLTEALLYPGVGLLEATNLATGRGTDTPFERVGAPYIEPVPFANALNDLNLPGLRAVPIQFQPTERQFAGTLCGGVHLIITDRQTFEPISLGIGLAATLRTLYPQHWEPDALMRLLADRATDQAIRDGADVATIERGWADELAAFRARRRPALLYRD